MSPGSLKHSSARPASFRGIQALRGIAALMVVLNHATLWWWFEVGPTGAPYSPMIWQTGGAGVDIFFIISGFVMAVAALGRRQETHPARRFLERRALRILPMYWFVTALFVADILLMRVLPVLQTHARFYAPLSWGHLISSLFLRPNYEHPIVSVAWTLTLECFFYLLFAVALAFKVKPLYLLTPLLLILGSLGFVQRTTWPGITVLLSPNLFEFLAGLLLGYAATHRHHISTVLASILGLAGVALLFVPTLSLPGSPVFARGLPAFLIILAAVALEDSMGHRWPRFLLLLGDASYSLYLAHILVIRYIYRLFEVAGVLVPGVIRFQDVIVSAVVTVIAAIPFSIALYLVVEKPMNNTLRLRLLGEGRPRAQIT